MERCCHGAVSSWSGVVMERRCHGAVLSWSGVVAVLSGSGVVTEAHSSRLNLSTTPCYPSRTERRLTSLTRQNDAAPGQPLNDSIDVLLLAFSLRPGSLLATQTLPEELSARRVARHGPVTSPASQLVEFVKGEWGLIDALCFCTLCLLDLSPSASGRVGFS